MKYIKSPTMALAMSTLILSTLMAVSSANWMFLWGAMELNLLSFIPIMMQSNNNQETEGAVKYFLAQALGSALLLMSSTSMWMTFSMISNFMPLILMAAIMLKLGSVPCHFWYPSVMASISWVSCLILSSWQKLAPLSILAFLLPQKNMNFMLSMAAMNALVGGVIGMNQTQLRTIMAYSSIGHIGWMMSLAAVYKPSSCIMYFVVYCILITPLFMTMGYLNMFSTKHMSKLSSYSSTVHMALLMVLLSLGGLPPFTGFMPKLMTIMLLMHSMKIILLVLIAGSIMNLFFYLNIVISSMSLPPHLKNVDSTDIKCSLKFVIPICTLSLGLSPFIMLYAMILLN